MGWRMRPGSGRRAGGASGALTVDGLGLVVPLAHAGVAWMLFCFGNGDATPCPVWTCSRDDTIGSLAVMGAAPQNADRSSPT